MAIEILNNGETGLSHRTKLNDNFEFLDTTKVDIVAGKELSDNNYTDAEKTKLSGVEIGAEVNTLNDVIAGTNITIDKSDPLNPIISSAGGAGGDLGDLDDVSISSPANGEVLTYNTTSGEWENNAIAGTGDVTGPASSIDENIVIFDGTTGKAIKDSGIKLSDKQNEINVIHTATDVSPAEKDTHYLVDASAGDITISLPNVTTSDKGLYRVTLKKDTHRVIITTVGGTQLIGESAELSLQTVGGSLYFKANGVDGYDVLGDSRAYYRIINLNGAGTTDLSASGYESGAIYHCSPGDGNTRTIIIPDSAAACLGNYAKFVLDGEGDVIINTLTSEEINGLSQQSITTGGFELTCYGDHYGITQDSRPKVVNTSLNIYALSEASTIGTYARAAVSTTDPDYSATAVDIPTGTITTTSQLLGGFITDEGVVQGLVTETNVLGFANFRRTTGTASANFYVEYYKRDSGGTETLIGTSNNTATIDSATYEQATISGTFPATTFLATDRLLIKLYGNNLGGGVNASFEMLAEGDNPARVSIAVPSGTVSHNSLAGIQLADNGVTYGHINDTAQTIAGVKTFSSSPIIPAPTTDLQAATKKYVDDNSGGGGGGGLLIDFASNNNERVRTLGNFIVSDTATASSLRMTLSVLPAGSDFIIELFKNGVSEGTVTIATTDTATNGIYQAELTSFTSGSYVAGDVLKATITQVGSTVAGSGLTLRLI